MKKITLVALVSFTAGIIIAAFIFVYSPKEKTQAATWEKPSESSLSTNIYAAPQQPTREIGDFAMIAEKLGPSVVGITAEKVQRRQNSRTTYDDSPFDEFWDRFFGTPRGRDQEYRSTAAGTGFFISPDGYILTNNHIVENAVKVTITSRNEQEYQAKIIGLDPETDLALLKVEAKDLPFATLGDSDAIKVGQWVMAIGNPLGLTHTVTAGIVSAKGRLLQGLDVVYQDFIQTDASINRGNSGGPLINMKGEVIGINSLIFAPSGGNIGIGFSISSNLAQKILKQLKDEGKVVRGYVGITCLPKIDSDIQKLLDLQDKKGAVVNSVVEGLPADKAGLKRYDVIKSVNGIPIEDRNDLFFKIAEIRPGSKTKFSIIRDGKEKVLEVKPMARESEEEVEPTASTSGEIGISVQAMTARIAQRYGYQTEKGLVVTEVKRYSEAENKGLEVGDIILEANRKPTNSIDDLENIVKRTKPGEAILLLVRKESRSRGGTYQDFIVTLRIPE